MGTLKVLPTQTEMVKTAEDFFYKSASAAIQQRGYFSIALSGGSTPLSLYKQLAEDQPGKGLDWDKVHFFWGDERAVPPDHPKSNYMHSKLALLQPRSIPESNIYRIRGELDPQAAAREYEEKLQDWFKDSLPRFDLILLGLGSDGHTASLFPGTQAVMSPQDFDLVAANHVPQLDAWRITLTAKIINNAKQILFLVSGKSKAKILFDVLENPQTANQYPAQNIRPTSGDLIWLIDQEAGSLLTVNHD